MPKLFSTGIQGLDELLLPSTRRRLGRALTVGAYRLDFRTVLMRGVERELCALERQRFPLGQVARMGAARKQHKHRHKGLIYKPNSKRVDVEASLSSLGLTHAELVSRKWPRGSMQLRLRMAIARTRAWRGA